MPDFLNGALGGAMIGMIGAMLILGVYSAIKRRKDNRPPSPESRDE